jgi:hypothetical protein
MINIKGKDKAEVLAKLFNASKQQGMGFLDKSGASELSIEEAQEIINDYTNFDYLRGRVMKVDLSGDEFCPWLYDRDNGEGAALAALT